MLPSSATSATIPPYTAHSAALRVVPISSQSCWSAEKVFQLPLSSIIDWGYMIRCAKTSISPANENQAKNSMNPFNRGE
jgi:hypothetical protein